MAAAEFHGFIQVMMLYDVCDEIDLDVLRQHIGGGRQASVFKHATPEYVKFERQPLIEPAGTVALQSGEQFSGIIRFYDFGVVSVLLRATFSGTWAELQQLSARLLATSELDPLTLAMVRERVVKLRPAMRKPFDNWLNEDYYIFHLLEPRLTATEVL